MNKKFQLLLEFLPLFIFFFTYKIFGLIPATISIICSTIISIVLMYIINKTLPSNIIIISTVILLIFGAITIFSNNTVFIKIKPTILYTSFAFILIIGICYRKYFIRYILGNILELTNKQWMQISLYWIGFLLLSAVLNEMVWRTYEEKTWVSFKVFAMPILTLLFTFVQLFIFKNNIKK